MASVTARVSGSKSRSSGCLAPAAVLLAAVAVALLGGCSEQGSFDVDRADQSVVRPIAVCRRNGRVTGTSTGTGFVIAPGYVATNDHVVRLPSECERYVVVPEGDWKNLLSAKVVWQSRELDLAVLHVPKLSRPAVTLSGLGPKRTPGKGERVAAIGFPTVSDKMLQAKTTGNRAHLISTFTQGAVSKVVVGTVPNTGSIERPMIQHTAPINKGNSGGPLFNMCNQVVGVNTYGAFIRITGEKRFGGTPVPGVYYAPHVSNLIKALGSEPELKVISPTIVSGRCRVTEGGLPVYIYVGGGLIAVLASLSLILALRRGTTREVVRVVESYSAWVRRKGVDTGTPRSPSVKTRPAARKERERPSSEPSQFDVETSPMAGRSRDSATGPRPAGVGDNSGYVLSGFDSDGNAVRLMISHTEVADASAGEDRGIIVGRSQSLSDKVLTDRSVSRRHARFSVADGQLMVEDLNSSYGTFVGGQATTPFVPAAVPTGSEVRLGEVKLDIRET